LSNATLPVVSEDCVVLDTQQEASPKTTVKRLEFEEWIVDLEKLFSQPTKPHIESPSTLYVNISFEHH